MSAILVALITAFFQFRTARRARAATEDVENLKAKLHRESVEHKARSDYEYDARRRLYEVCEPLLFQLRSHALEARDRIQGIASACARGDITPEDCGWFYNRNEYYLESSIYRLLRPIATLDSLQTAVTAIDLRLDVLVARQFAAASLLQRAFSDDFVTARSAGLEYDRIRRDGDDDWEIKLRDQPARYWRQGVSSGRQSRAVNAITDENRQILPFQTFSELYRETGSEVNMACERFGDLLYGFHPSTRPVLWLQLVRFACIAEILGNLGDAFQDRDYLAGQPLSELLQFDESFRRSFDWRTDPGPESDESVLVKPFAIAATELQEKLSPAFRPSATLVQRLF